MHQTLKPPYPHVSQTPEASAFQAQKSVCSSDMLKIQLLVKSLWKVEWRCQVRLVPLLGQVLDHPIAFDRFRRPARAGGAERSNAVAELECDTTRRCLYPDSVAIEEPAASVRLKRTEAHQIGKMHHTHTIRQVALELTFWQQAGSRKQLDAFGGAQGLVGQELGLRCIFTLTRDGHGHLMASVCSCQYENFMSSPKCIYFKKVE